MFKGEEHVSGGTPARIRLAAANERLDAVTGANVDRPELTSQPASDPIGEALGLLWVGLADFVEVGRPAGSVAGHVGPSLREREGVGNSPGTAGA